MKEYFSNDFRNLLEGIFKKQDSKRFTLQQVKEHKFFNSVNWDDVLACKQKAPIIPKLSKNPESAINISKELQMKDLKSCIIGDCERP